MYLRTRFRFFNVVLFLGPFFAVAGLVESPNIVEVVALEQDPSRAILCTQGPFGGPRSGLDQVGFG